MPNPRDSLQTLGKIAKPELTAGPVIIAENIFHAALRTKFQHLFAQYFSLPPLAGAAMPRLLIIRLFDVRLSVKVASGDIVVTKPSILTVLINSSWRSMPYSRCSGNWGRLNLWRRYSSH